MQRPTHTMEVGSCRGGHPWLPDQPLSFPRAFPTSGNWLAGQKCPFAETMIHRFGSACKHVTPRGSLICFYCFTVRDNPIKECDKVFCRGLLFIPLPLMPSGETPTHKFTSVLSLHCQLIRRGSAGAGCGQGLPPSTVVLRATFTEGWRLKP